MMNGIAVCGRLVCTRAGAVTVLICMAMAVFAPLWALAKPAVDRSWVSVYQECSPQAGASVTTPQASPAASCDEAFGRHLDTLTSFYSTVITVLTVMLGAVVTLAFFTIRAGTRAEQEKAILNALDSQSMRSHIEARVASSVEEQIGDVAQTIEELQQLYESLDDIVIARDRKQGNQNGNHQAKPDDQAG